MSRLRDLSFEALVTATGANVSNERGTLNKALAQIREAEAELQDEDLALLIALRASAYRRAFPGMALTPMALSKHWARIEGEVAKPTYAEPTPGDLRCSTCNGHRMVVARERISPNPRSPYEEWAPCPSCNSTTSGTYWRWDGSKHQMIDPSDVRSMIE